MHAITKPSSHLPRADGIGALVDLLHHDERAAREALLAGCEADLRHLEALMLRTFASLRPTAQSAGRARRTLEDNANLRLRARFGLYASALVEAENGFINNVYGRLPEREWARLRPPRRFAVPRLDLCAVALPAPPNTPDQDTIETWARAVAAAMRETLRAEVEHARDVVTQRGASSLSRVQVVVSLSMRRWA